MSFRALRMPLLAGLVLSISSCLESTQVTFNISTDVPCSAAGDLSITVGIEGQTEKSGPTKTATQCSPDGMLTAVGSYAVNQKPGKEVVASIKVAFAPKGLDVVADCTSAKGYEGCIVARRRISFLSHRSLTVPIDMLLICKGVQCDENTTCNKTGRCVNSLLDITKCDTDGTCKDIVTRTGEGLPCFNEGQSVGLFCNGDDAWCTRTASGQRKCSDKAVTGGISFQCRNSQDCGPNLQCVAGKDGVLGTCVTMPTVLDTVLCKFGEPVTPCPTGPFGCAVDAGPGLFSCLPLDGGVVENKFDGGLPCPRTGNFACYAPTPFCQTITGTPTCVADGGAQCWYPSDCAAGNGCFAGVDGQFFNSCQPAKSRSNPVPLCDERRDGGDCPAGHVCDGQFYGFRACRDLNPPAVQCPPSSDAGLTCAGDKPVCQQQSDAGYACVSTSTTSGRSWACTDSRVCFGAEKCVYKRAGQRAAGQINGCAVPIPDGGQAIACSSAAECAAGQTCGPAIGEDGLKLCTNASSGCDRNFFTSNTCGVGANCCNAGASRVCAADRFTCATTDAGMGVPWECDTAWQCGAHQLCANLNVEPGLPFGGVVCVDQPGPPGVAADGGIIPGRLPDGGLLTVRNVHCQPETAGTDCPPAYPECDLVTGAGNYVCRAADAGINGPGANIQIGIPWR